MLNKWEILNYIKHLFNIYIKYTYIYIKSSKKMLVIFEKLNAVEYI